MPRITCGIHSDQADRIEEAHMLTTLEHYIRQSDEAKNQLILLTGQRGSGKTRLLNELGDKRGVQPLNINLALGRRLAVKSQADRPFSVAQLLNELAAHACKENDLLLLDNFELLFEPGLRVNPLDLIKGLAHTKPVVAVWPGELRANRLYYAEMTHPEYRDYAADGVLCLKCEH